MEVAIRQARHMKQMLDDPVGPCSRQRGQDYASADTLDLGREVQQALDVAHGLSAVSEHVVSVSLPVERVYVNGDQVRLGQCFGNLFTIAAKYTNLGGRIDVSLERDDGGAMVRVRDDGVGVPADCCRSSSIFPAGSSWSATVHGGDWASG